MEGRYSPGLWVVLADCTDPAQEAQFNEWYNQSYIPEMETLAFLRNTRRYENVFGSEATFRGRPKYLALSEVYADDMKEALMEIRHCDAQLKAQQQGFTMVTKLDTVYRRIGPVFRSERTGRRVRIIACILPGCADTTREDEFNAWYNEKHSPETIETGLWDTGYRYRAADLHDPVPHHTTPYITFYESSASIDLSTRHERIRKKQQKDALEDPVWFHLLEVYYIGTFGPIYP